jgi:hypothetical protein
MLFEFQDAVGDAVQKGAVMGYRDHGALEAVDGVLEQLETREIEVVARLVQEENV